MSRIFGRAERKVPKAPADPGAALQACVAAVDAEDPNQAVREAFQQLAGTALPVGQWQDALYTALARNEILYQLSITLDQPGALRALPVTLLETVGRPVSEEEILAWLTLGAAARREERPLVRPVVHAFVKGISGAVVSFPAEHPALAFGWLPRTR
jgi:hypothetical protein